MAEHTPAPTPHRAVYGFAFFILFKTLLFLYLFWAFVPVYILEDKLHLTYLPDKYFALILPILIMVAIMFFGFLIYPFMNLSMTSNIDDISTIQDKYTIKRCKFNINQKNVLCNQKINFNNADKNWNNFCELHKNQLNTTENINIDNNYKDINNIENFCDCLDKTKCLLAKNPNHIKLLNKRKTVPSVCDLDISDVCKQIFG